MSSGSGPKRRNSSRKGFARKRRNGRSKWQNNLKLKIEKSKELMKS